MFNNNYGGFGAKVSSGGGSPTGPAGGGLSGEYPNPTVLPVNPAIDGVTYFQTVLDGVRSWTAAVDGNGTPAPAKALMFTESNWTNGAYSGVTPITGTKGGQSYYAVSSNGSYYIYMCFVDNLWVRTLAS